MYSPRLCGLVHCVLVLRANNMCYWAVIAILVASCFVVGSDCERIRGDCRYVCNTGGNTGGNWIAKLNEESSGLLEVNLTLPEVQGNFSIELFVAKTAEVCEPSVFREGNYEVHTVRRKICLYDSPTINVPFCQDGITLWYDWIFAGCYALGLRNENESDLSAVLSKSVPVILAPTNLTTNLEKPTGSLNYSITGTYIVDPDKNPGSGILKVEINHENSTEASHMDPPGRYNIPRMTMIMFNNCKPDCKGENKDSLAICKLYRNDGAPICDVIKSKYIFGTPTVNVDRQDRTEWKFNVSANISRYAVIMEMGDVRCHTGGTWNGYILKDCQKRVHIEKQVVPSESPPKPKEPYELIIIAAVFIAAFIVAAASFIIWFILKGGITLSAGSPMEEELTLNNNRMAILLMYVKDSKEFMDLMTEFRNSLKQNCQCDVYDWYAPDDSKKMTIDGATAWTQNLLTSGKRTVWVDTKRARSLITNRLDKKKSSKQQQGKISDHRDVAFPLTLDFAKCALHDPSDQYCKHFVVRFEKFSAEEGEYDPFAQISPHTRYQMYDHFDQLCSDLTNNVSART